MMAAIERAYPRVQTRGPYAVRDPENPRALASEQNSAGVIGDPPESKRS
jgi:hypothetical protein